METPSKEINNSLKRREEILFWKSQLENLRDNYEKLLKNENELYKEQLAELEKNHTEKVEILEKKYKKRLELIEKDAENQRNVLKNEFAEKKEKIPILQQNTVQQQIEMLQKEFPESFDYYAKLNLRFLNEFTKGNRKKFLLEVDENEMLLSNKQIKKDLNNSLTALDNEKLYFNRNVLKYGEKEYTILSNIKLQFSKMEKMFGIIKNINNDSLEFQENGNDKTITIPFEAIKLGIIKIIDC